MFGRKTAQNQQPESPVLTFTEAAKQRVRNVMDKQRMQGYGVRLAIQGQSQGQFTYHMEFVEPGEESPTDTVVDVGPFKVLVDDASLPNLRGTAVDYREQLGTGSFQFDNPNAPLDAARARLQSDPAAAAVQQILETQINPQIAAHGGYAELIDVRDDLVYIRLGGGCQGCGMADVTLKQGIEVMIKDALPQIREVLDVTDHASGQNPYYQPSKGGAGASPYYQPAKG